jgi:hypothetical protein
MAVPRLRRSRRGGRQVFGLQDQVRLGKRKHTASRLGSATTMMISARVLLAASGRLCVLWTPGTRRGGVQQASFEREEAAEAQINDEAGATSIYRVCLFPSAFREAMAMR